MYETTDTPRLTSTTKAARLLHPVIHRTYSIEDDDQTQAYVRLAALAAAIDSEGGLILSVNVSYEQDDVDFYNIVVTVAV